MGGGGVAILQYHHGVPDLPVPELHLNFRPRRRLATTPFNWSGPRSMLCGKHHPVGPGLVTFGYLVDLLSQPPFRHSVLSLVVHHQLPL